MIESKDELIINSINQHQQSISLSSSNEFNSNMANGAGRNNGGGKIGGGSSDSIPLNKSRDKETKKTDQENEKKRQSFMTHWKYRPSAASVPNPSSTAPPLNTSNNNIPVEDVPDDQPVQPGDGGEGFNKGRRNSAPSMRNFVSHWKYDPKGLARQQRQLQIIGEHQQMMMKREQQQQELAQQIYGGGDGYNNSNVAKSTFHHPYSRKPGSPLTSPRGSISIPNDSSQPSLSSQPQQQQQQGQQQKVERRFSLPGVSTTGYSNQQQQYQQQQQQNYQQTLSPPQQQPYIISSSPNVLSPQMNTTTPRGVYLDSIPENPYYPESLGSSPTSIGSSFTTNNISPPFSPPFSPTLSPSFLVKSPPHPYQLSSSTTPPGSSRSTFSSSNNNDVTYNVPYNNNNKAIFNNNSQQQQQQYHSTSKQPNIYQIQSPPPTPEFNPSNSNNDPFIENKLPPMRNMLSKLNIEDEEIKEYQDSLLGKSNNTPRFESSTSQSSKMCITNLVQ